MQGQDTVETLKIESEFVCGMVSGQIEKALREKNGYDINIRIEKITIKEKDGRVRAHFKGKAETKATELKKICGNSGFMKNLVTLFLNSRWSLTDNLVVGFLEKAIKQNLGAHVDIEMKDKKYTEKDGKATIFLDMKAEVREEKLEEILKKKDVI